jgi:L-asparaginase II
VQAIGVRSPGLGIAVKVADGHKRALYPAVVSVLDQLGLVVDAATRAALAPWARRTLRNYRGVETGAVRSVVVLDKGAPFARGQSA